MPMSSLHFVIIEKDSFIAADMAEGLRGACPNCTVTNLTEMCDAAALPPDPLHRRIFITGERITAIDQSGLSGMAAAEGAEIVVRAGWDSDEAVRARGFLTLAAPFTDADLYDIATRALGQRQMMAGS
ncbi:hypothetical protein DRW48_12465 [Paracoccus suum]|uniref:Response regulatory domain-containing protein n=1 Tax=Paracoccus suum TaxID=2259340 RepID=A0A344PLY4_9RHOB|nr:hypothetical protein [Paracoccus suum]AXC50389.1 hypothetical protein DRW48_12465 [Paracoccus suum]